MLLRKLLVLIFFFCCLCFLTAESMLSFLQLDYYNYFNSFRAFAVVYIRRVGAWLSILMIVICCVCVEVGEVINKLAISLRIFPASLPLKIIHLYNNLCLNGKHYIVHAYLHIFVYIFSTTWLFFIATASDRCASDYFCVVSRLCAWWRNFCHNHLSHYIASTISHCNWSYYFLLRTFCIYRMVVYEMEWRVFVRSNNQIYLINEILHFCFGYEKIASYRSIWLLNLQWQRAVV